MIGRLTAAPADGSVRWSGPPARLVTHDAHAPGHSAVFIAGLGLLAAGDMLSDVELPGIDWSFPNALDDYRRGLDLLGALREVSLVVPGHGRVGDETALQTRVAADRRYLEALAAGGPFDDPRIIGWPPMREQHAANLAGLRGRAT